ncbi:glycosyltransferase [Vibrio viridaestus]|nr:glycosyltransferase [Vibrio viridaestus]
MTHDLSIIIPCFNNQSDIDNITYRLMSIRDNSELQFEVIIIDDGSELPISVADEVANKLNLKLVHKINEGVSKARNTGLELSNAEFCVFIDSDDNVDDKFFSIVNDAIKTTDIDLAYFPYRIIKNGQPTLRGSDVVGSSIGHNLLKSIFLKKTFFHICSFVFKVEFLRRNNLKFHEEIRLSEDVLFVVSCLSKSKYIFASENAYFNYIDNSVSVINTDQGLKELNHLIAFSEIKSLDVSNLNKSKNFFILTCCINLLFRVLRRKSSDKMIKKTVLTELVNFSKSIGPSTINLTTFRGAVVFTYITALRCHLGRFIIYIGH